MVPAILIIPSVCILIPFGSLWAGSLSTYDKQTHTFTRSLVNEGVKPAKNSNPSSDSPTPEPATPDILTARAQSAYTAGFRSTSITNKSVASSTSIEASIPPPIPARNPHRQPNGLLDAELYENETTELQDRQTSPTRPADLEQIARPFTPRPSRADPSRPDEMV